MEKSIHEFKVEFMYLSVGERKKTTFLKLLLSLRIVNPLFKKDFKNAEHLTKTSFFFLYFRDRPKNSQANKQRRRRKYIQITKGGES